MAGYTSLFFDPEYTICLIVLSLLIVVAIFTHCIPVQPGQRECRLVMGKQVPVKQRNAGGLTLVLGMAVAAFRFVQLAMETISRIEIPGNLRVAFNTESCLFVSAEFAVT